MRTPKPWYRQQTDTWCVCFRGKQIPLAKGKRSKREADEAFHRLMAVSAMDSFGPAGPTKAAVNNHALQVVVLLDQFLDWVEQNLDCFEWHRRFIQDFADACGGLTVGELKPIHVTNWLAKKKTWGPSTRNRVIGAVKQAFNWAVDQGLIESSPIKSLKKPPANRRERIVSLEERQKIFAAIKGQPFRDFLTALQETGARPGEIRLVTAADFDLQSGVWLLKKHKTSKKTHRPRVIYLTPAMRELTTRLALRHPDGPLFRNKYDQPWSSNAIRIRFRTLRKRFPELAGVVAYCYRHAFTTDGMVRGVPIATMAELLGHSSTAMIEKHYGHLAKVRSYLHQAAFSVTQREPDGCA